MTRSKNPHPKHLSDGNDTEPIETNPEVDFPSEPKETTYFLDLTSTNEDCKTFIKPKSVQIYHKKPKKSSSDNYEAANSSILNNWYDSPTSPRFGISKPKPKLDIIQSCKYWNVKPSDAFVWEWIRDSLTIKIGSKLSASDVLNAFEAYREKNNENSDNSNPDPRASCHKVGMLVRRLFPDIQRCKITVNGKRIWVYRNLALVKDVINHHQPPPPPPLTTSSSTDLQLWNTPSRPSPPIFDPLLKKSSSDPSTMTSSPHEASNSTEISEWLRANYEYNAESCVRSSDVLEQYNRVHNAKIRFLSQIGRIIRVVFPNARHIRRRSCKGGKREWLYEHIRPRSRASNAMTSATSQFTPLRKPLMTPQKRRLTTMITSSKQSRISTVEVICGSKSESSSSGDVASSLTSPVTSLGDDDDDDVTKKVAKWKLLQELAVNNWCGWTRLKMTSSTLEFVLFDERLLCDGGRVFRELLIEDNFNIRCFALSRRIQTPCDDVIDVSMRTASGFEQIFQQIARLRVCRGVSAFQFSSITLHSIVIATTEVWSSRDNPSEQLRHRSVNCPILFATDEDCDVITCSRCLPLQNLANQS